VTPAEIIAALALAVAGYACGSISFAIVVGKWGMGVDVREHGSGNVGATNVFRVLGWKAAVLVFLGDFMKGLVPTLVAVYFFGPWIAVIVGASTVCGHMFSVFLRGSGGKGVATAAGVATALMWHIFIPAIILWALVLVVSRMVSLASIVASSAFVAMTFIIDEPLAYQLFSLVTCLAILWRHRANIRRIALGSETRVRFPWNAAPQESDQAEESQP